MADLWIVKNNNSMCFWLFAIRMQKYNKFKYLKRKKKGYVFATNIFLYFIHLTFGDIWHQTGALVFSKMTFNNNGNNQ